MNRSVFPESSDSADTKRIVFDEAGVMDRLGRNRKLAEMMLQTFFKNVPLQIQSMKEALDRKDAERVSKWGHTLKGSCATAGAVIMKDTAYQIEKAGKDGDLEKVDALIDNLRLGLEEMKKAAAEAGYV